MNLGGLFLVVLLLLAGCQEAPADDLELTPSSSGSRSSQATSAPETPTPPPIILADQIQWTGCRGIFTTFFWPGPTNPAPNFPPWEERDATAISETRTVAMDCVRFGFGEIERGPVQFVLELTNEPKPPEACLAMEPESQPMNIVNAWASDAEIALALTGLGFSMGIAPIALTFDEGTAHASWTIPGGESVLDSYQEGEPAAPTFFLPIPWRLFWENPEGGVSALEFGNRVQGPPQPSDRLVVGEFAEPMSMAGPYTGPGFQFSDGNFGGLITRFKDVACESPSA